MQCPTDSPAGAFTKHPNPQDCGKFYLCISGIPRDQTCTAGLVFDYGDSIHTTWHLSPRHHVPGTGNGIDGKCTSIEDVPECADYKSDNPDADRVE